MIFYYLVVNQISSMATTCNIDNCIQCSSSSPDICLDCLLPYKLSSSGCHLTDEERTEKITNCLFYNEDQTCLKCIDGFHVFNGFCEADCQDGCVCFDPYVCINKINDESAIIHKRRTEECDPICITCSTINIGECLECPEGYTIDGWKCRYCPNSNCEICRYDYYCILCDSGYYSSSGTCYECSSGCDSCTENLYCYKCKSGYNRSKGKCKKESSSTVGLIVGIVVGITILIL